MEKSSSSEMVTTDSDVVTPGSDMTSPEGTLDERTITCDEPEIEVLTRAGGSDSGVELGAGAPGGIDGYASGLESLIGGAASTSCESSLLSFSGDLENVVSGIEDGPPRSGSGNSGSSRGRRTATPGTPGSRHSPTVPPLNRASAATSSRRVERSDNKSTSQATKTSASRGPRRTEARSASRGRTPPVSTDDGRWPSVSIGKTARRSPNVSVMTTSLTHTPNERRTPRAATTPVDTRCSTFDKYATLPRRKRVVVALTPPETDIIKESKPISREPSLNRAASLRRQRTTAVTSGSSSGYRSDAEDVSGSSIRSKSLTRTLPPYPRKRRSHNMRDAAAQTASEPRCPEELEAQLERLSKDYTRVQAALSLGEQVLQTERAQREVLQEEAEVVAKRVAAILRSDGVEMASRTDWLTDIEARMQATSDVAARHQKDLLKAQRLNRSLSEEVERARTAAQTARQQLTDAEEEAAELQEFLTEEKNMLAESLREAEDKIASLTKQLDQKEKDIERQQEECRHLVRLSEQRRQEAGELEAKVAATERYLVSQGGCTTAASVALAGLCSRLECLIPQLSSPKEEVEIFLNEAYAPSVEASPENRRKSSAAISPCSPARSSQTTDEDMISQIRSPAGLHEDDDEEDTTSSQRLVGSESLRDLTQAIISCHSTIEHPPTPPQNCTSNTSLADQASELDQLVSKLLATFQNLLHQRELSVIELNKCRLKFDSEHLALTEANSQLESQERRVRQLEAAQRISQQTGADELTSLREKLSEKERQLAEMTSKAVAGRQLLITNWRQAAEELRRQYEAIDKALEVMHKEQALVGQSPALSQLQRELEETNFHCVSLPSPVPEDFQSLTANSMTVTENLSPLKTLHMPTHVNGTA